MRPPMRPHPTAPRRDLFAVLAATLCMVAPLACSAAGTARIEVHPFATRDVPTPALLSGDLDATTASTPTIAGELRLPIASADKVPAVVFLHGDAGAVWNQPRWIDDLNAMGIAVFTVDSFSGRGAIAQSAQPGSIEGPVPGLGSRIADAYGALELLSRHPRIDAHRIAVIGVSSGGRAALASAMKRFSTRFARDDTRYAAYVALYPPCAVRLGDEERVEAGPMRIFIGGADDVTGAASCERFAARLRKTGADVETTVYAGAYHGFDNPAGVPMTRLADVPGFARCELEERDGHIVNVETGAPPATADRCVARGFTAGRDADADAAVRAAVAGFLSKVFAIGP